MELILPIYIFVVGITLGSFLNVVIYRLPRNQDLVFKRSHCPHCSNLIRWYHNIPLFSFIALKGKCGHCQGKISWKYPVVELLTGLAAVYFSPAEFELPLVTLALFQFSVFCVFLCHFFIDIEHQLLPDVLNLYLAALFMAYAIAYLPWGNALVGGLVGFLFPLAITWIFYRIKGQVGLGGGDIKLFGALGIYLGPVGVFQNLFLSCFIGSLFTITLILMKKMKRTEPIPFGPFIIVTASLQIFFPDFLSRFFTLIGL